MELIEGILTRRSIRKYTSEDVDEETVTKILKAAMAAPSAGNQQPWEFVVIRERSIIDEIPKFQPYSKMLAEAPLAIVICGDVTRQRHKGYWVQDCSAATQNLLLAVHALGLGAVWLAFYPVEERYKPLQTLLGLPEHIIPLSTVSIGHPAEAKPPADRFDAARIHNNSW